MYDCMDALADRGLVDVQEGTPRRFRAVAPDAATTALERRCRDRLDRLDELLPRLEAPEPRDEEGDVWTVHGGEEVSQRAASLVAEAAEDLLLAVASPDLLSDGLVSALSAASSRGVDVTVGSPSADIRDLIDDSLPEATVVETWTWWESYPVEPGAVTCVVMVDGHSLLVSTDDASSLPGVNEHRAVWTDSEAAPIVGLLSPLLARAILGHSADGDERRKSES
ncbi:TrmB family transcriptional regulator sugar-binding domain-containing protein [Haloarculaceae archaeon H-GB2-1]|nr:TrmB family transcriptional regulator sugar-binding domain-containing protein [Haloarculaceae archaeon H-GB2-1]